MTNIHLFPNKVSQGLANYSPWAKPDLLPVCTWPWSKEWFLPFFFFLKIGKPEEEEYFMTCKYCMKFEFQCHKWFYWKITVLVYTLFMGAFVL